MSNVLDGGNDDSEDNGAAGDSDEFIDQDNFAEEEAYNVGLQDQDAEQEQDATQEDFDVTVQRTPTPTTPPPPDDGLPPEVEPPRENGKIAFVRPIAGNPFKKSGS
jgi:hypothetical protein